MAGEVVMALNTDHDIYVTNGVIVDALDSDAIMQTVKTRLLSFEQDWFLDLTAGLPWFTQMVGANIHMNEERSLIAQEILATEGVYQLESLALSQEGTTRVLSVSFRYIDIHNKSIEVAV